MKSGIIPIFANLLSHENTDIAIDVVEVIQELTDEDVGGEVDDLDGEEETGSETRMAMGQLIDELVSLPSVYLTWTAVAHHSSICPGRKAEQLSSRLARFQPLSSRRIRRYGLSRCFPHSRRF